MSKSPPINAFWQDGRMLPALTPSGTPMEGRSNVDLVGWAEGMAGLLTYVDHHGQDHHPKPDNTPPHIPWAAFLRSDIVLLLAEICNGSNLRNYQRTRRQTDNLHAVSTSLLNDVLDWHDRAKELAQFAKAESIEAALDAVLTNALVNELYKAVPMRFKPDPRELVAPAIDIFMENDLKNHIVYSLLARVTEQIAGLAQGLLERALSQKSDHPPQVGLLLAFLEMYSRVQEEMNGIGERHLDYYFGKVLDMKPRPAQSDRVDVCFELAPQTDCTVLPQGSRLVGADSGSADPVVFATESELRVDPIVLAEQKALRVRREPDEKGAGWITGISAYPVVNSKDGLGKKFDLPGTPWDCFGPKDEAPETEASIGFALAASTLSAQGGERKITLTLSFAHSENWSFASALEGLRKKVGGHDAGSITDGFLCQEIKNALIVTVTSGKQSSFEVQNFSIAIGPKRDALNIILNVSHDDPPIAADPTDTGSPDEPVVKITFNPNASTYGVSLFVGARVEEVEIGMEVCDCRTSVLSTGSGPIDPTKSFEPFGAFAEAGSALFIDNPVLHQPELKGLALSLTWKGLPETSQDFAAHYQGYETQPSADDFRVSLEISQDKSWYSLCDHAEDYPLFSCTQPGNKLSRVSRFIGLLSAKNERVSHAAQPSALRLVLVAPKEGFGQSAYTGALTSFALDQVKAAEGLLAKIKPPEKATPPNPPLKLEVSDLTISYLTKQNGRPDDPIGKIRFFSLTPLGHKSLDASGRIVDDDYGFDGAYVMGFSGITPPQEISLYFDIDTSLGAPWSRQGDQAFPELVWRYFDGADWCNFDETANLEDGTLGLRKAGIVRISLPTKLASGPRYPGDLLWIALSMKGDTSQIGDMHAVRCNAVSALRLPDDRIPRLPANTLVRLQSPNSGIKKIFQSRPSYGGREAEDVDTFRVRVSERLSHKGRAIAPRDYGRIILEAFPEIAQVSVVTKSDGRLVIYAAPKRESTQDPELRLPYWQRKNLADWLGSYLGLQRRRILVLSPACEEIRVSVSVLESRGAMPGLLRRVNLAINRAIAPWLNDPQSVLPIGASRLDTAALSAAIEEVDGVDRVAGLAVVQLYRDEAGAFRLKDTANGEDAARLRILQGFDQGSVFVPAKQHAIRLITQPATDHDEMLSEVHPGSDHAHSSPREVKAKVNDDDGFNAAAQEFGIGEMRIGSDFILSEPTDTYIARADRIHPSAPYPTRFPPFENGTHS